MRRRIKRATRKGKEKLVELSVMAGSGMLAVGNWIKKQTARQETGRAATTKGTTARAVDGKEGSPRPRRVPRKGKHKMGIAGGSKKQMEDGVKRGKGLEKEKGRKVESTMHPDRLHHRKHRKADAQTDQRATREGKGKLAELAGMAGSSMLAAGNWIKEKTARQEAHMASIKKRTAVRAADGKKDEGGRNEDDDEYTAGTASYTVVHSVDPLGGPCTSSAYSVDPQGGPCASSSTALLCLALLLDDRTPNEERRRKLGIADEN